MDYLISLKDEEELYTKVSGDFNKINQNFYAQANIELLKHLDLKPGVNVLELACGTGHLAVEIAKKIDPGQVLGVDLSEKMLLEGRRFAEQEGVKNIEFVKKNIHHFLPELKTKNFNIGVSCFALSYLGYNFLLKEMFQILGPKGQVGMTTSSMNSLVEWEKIFLPPFIKKLGQAFKFIPDMPRSDTEMKQRMEKIGFTKVQVKAIKIPLVFESPTQAAIFLIASNWISGAFYRIKTPKMRRALFNYCKNKMIRHYGSQARLETSIEFLVAWNGR